jgi:hypothetical protein
MVFLEICKVEEKEKDNKRRRKRAMEERKGEDRFQVLTCLVFLHSDAFFGNL